MTQEQALQDVIERQYDALEDISGVALTLPKLLIEALERQSPDRLTLRVVAIEQLAKIARETDDVLMRNTIAGLITELRRPRLCS